MIIPKYSFISFSEHLIRFSFYSLRFHSLIFNNLNVTLYHAIIHLVTQAGYLIVWSTNLILILKTSVVNVIMGLETWLTSILESFN